MRIKVSPLDSELLKQSSGFFTLIIGIGSAVLTFLDLNAVFRLRIFGGIVVLVSLVYISKYVLANIMSKLTLTTGNSTIEIREGNIFDAQYFSNTDFIKVFSFNEYFDTQVDNEIISKQSLNGQVLNRLGEVNSHVPLDKRMVDNKHLQRMQLSRNTERRNGKQLKYRLGTIFKYSDDIFFTALTHFDENNRAELTIQDYVRFLVNFWDEIDEFYAGRTVIVTLFGSGITRLEKDMYTNQQILQIILWTFNLRRIKFKKPAKFLILLDQTTNREINYFQVRRDFNGLQK
jgi:hypothetical protein